MKNSVIECRRTVCVCDGIHGFTQGKIYNTYKFTEGGLEYINDDFGSSMTFISILMILNSDGFMSLSEWRNKKLESIL